MKAEDLNARVHAAVYEPLWDKTCKGEVQWNDWGETWHCRKCGARGSNHEGAVHSPKPPAYIEDVGRMIRAVHDAGATFQVRSRTKSALLDVEVYKGVRAVHRSGENLPRSLAEALLQLLTEGEPRGGS